MLSQSPSYHRPLLRSLAAQFRTQSHSQPRRSHAPINVVKTPTIYCSLLESLQIRELLHRIRAGRAVFQPRSHCGKVHRLDGSPRQSSDGDKTGRGQISDRRLTGPRLVTTQPSRLCRLTFAAHWHLAVGGLPSSSPQHGDTVGWTPLLTPGGC